MPELPEVQTIVSELDRKLKNKTIEAADVFAEKSVNLPCREFEAAMVGVKISGVSRRAKMIIISLSGGRYLLVHLKMTGQLIFFPPLTKGRTKEGLPKGMVSGGHPIPPPNLPLKKGEEKNWLPNKFTRVAISFNGGSKLFFNDIRRFGWMRLVDESGLDKVVSKYGIEPLGEEFTFRSFDAILEKFPKRKIKQILLDQSLIAGVGNIYADESCFLAGIMPTRTSGSLTLMERKKLFKAIPRVLTLSISKGGTSADTYIRTDGSRGSMVDFLNVYKREGEICKLKNCRGTIRRMRLNGRGTHYCEGCQK